MKWKFQTAGRLLALLALSGALLAAPLPAQAAPGVLTGLTGTGSKLELELTEMELEITDDDPRPKGYLYTSGQSDYYFIVWMSSNSNVATVDGDGKVTGRNAGTAIITAISDHGERAACKVTVTRKNEEAARKKPVRCHRLFSSGFSFSHVDTTALRCCRASWFCIFFRLALTSSFSSFRT